MYSSYGMLMCVLCACMIVCDFHVSHALSYVLYEFVLLFVARLILCVTNAVVYACL